MTLKTITIVFKKITNLQFSGRLAICNIRLWTRMIFKNIYFFYHLSLAQRALPSFHVRIDRNKIETKCLHGQYWADRKLWSYPKVPQSVRRLHVLSLLLIVTCHKKSTETVARESLVWLMKNYIDDNKIEMWFIYKLPNSVPLPRRCVLRHTKVLCVVNAVIHSLALGRLSSLPENVS